MTVFPVRPTIPARPAAYIRDPGATTAGSPGMAAGRDSVIAVVQDLGWPAPAVYADAGEPGSQLAALIEAIRSGHHDGVFAYHPAQISCDLAQIEAFDRLCRQHGVRLRFRWCEDVTDTRALFDAIHDAREFTVTDEHLRLLRRTYISWDGTEFGAPQIDPKRPYGNSNVFGDIAQILDMPGSAEAEDEEEDEELDPLLEWRFLRLHIETAIALQIALATGEFRTGRYVCDDEWAPIYWRRDEA